MHLAHLIRIVLVTVGCLAMSGLPSIAQTPQELVNIAQAWDGKMAPEKAVPLLKQIVAVLTKEKPSPLLHNMLAQLAANLEFVNDIDEADRTYSQWSESVTITDGKDSYAHAVVLVKWGMLLVTDQRSEKAETLLKQALPIIEKKDPGGPDMVFTLQQLEGVAIHQAKWKDAEELRGRYLDLVEKKHGRPSQELALALAKASHGLHEEEKHDECEKLARESVEFFESNDKADTEAASAAYNALGTSLMGLRRWAEAEAAYQKAYAIDVKHYGKDDIRSTTSVNNLANSITQVADIQDDKERLEKAEAMFREYMRVAEKTFGSNHPRVAIALSNIASVLQRRFSFTEAEALLMRAVQMEDRLPKKSPTRIHTKINLIGSIMGLGRYKEAETLCEKTLTEAKETFGEDHALVASVMHTRGNLLVRLGRAIEAEQSFWEAMKIREVALGKDHADVALSLFNLAKLVQARGDNKNPESMLRRVVKIDEKAFGKDSPRVGYDIFALADCLMLQKRWKDAREEIDKVITLFEKSFGKEHHFIGDVLMTYAAILQQEKKHIDQEKILRRALAIHKKALGDNHNTTARTMIELAVNLRVQEKLNEAERIARTAFLIFSNQSGANRIPAEMLGQISDIYFLILIELHYPRNLIQERIEMIHEGNDPGPLPTSRT